MAPSQIQIATQSLQRLIKEEASYHKELESQKKRIEKLEKTSAEDDEDGNRDFMLKQERKAMEETNAVFPTMRERITTAREKLESYLDSSTDEAELEKAREVLKLAKEAQKDDPIASA